MFVFIDVMIVVCIVDVISVYN